jgi:hypothetical protein
MKQTRTNDNGVETPTFFIADKPRRKLCAAEAPSSTSSRSLLMKSEKPMA